MIDRLEFARKLAENKGSVQQFAIEQSLKMLRDAGVIDPGLPADKTSLRAVGLFAKVYPKISLPEEHRRQALVCIAKGYAQKLNMSQEDYIKSLPDFSEKPPTYDELGLKVPLIVETRIPWMEMAEISGIYASEYLREKANNGDVSNWEEDRFEMPEIPFSAWVQDGSRFVNRRPSDVRKELLEVDKYKDYWAGRKLVVLAIANVRPGLVKTMFWDVIGTVVGSDCVPCLHGWLGDLRLYTRGADFADPRYRALVLGREIRTLNLAA